MRGIFRRIATVTLCVTVCMAPMVMSTEVGAVGLKPITAKVPTGYRLVAMSKVGQITIGTVKKGVTSVVPPSSVVTLHLISSAGIYSGPVVVSTKKVGSSTRAILGVRAGASVGKITYKPAGYGKAQVKGSSIVTSLYANTQKGGTPYGAGSLGYVSGASKSSVQAASVRAMADEGDVGGDPDKDGIPNAVDVDDNGNGILDVVDDKTIAATSGKSGPRPYIFSDFFVDLVDIIRVTNAATADATKEVVKNRLKFVFGTSAENGAVAGVHIDCQGIAWCGTATVFSAPGSTPPLWSTIDKDGDGRFFDLDQRVIGQNMNFDSSVKPNVYPAEVVPGQMFNFELTYTTGKRVVIPSALTSFFVTAPAPTRIGATDISYPVPANTGTMSNPILTANGAILRIETHRPMRPLMPKEVSSVGMKEMGGLRYWITLSRVGEGKPPSTCNAMSYSSPSSNLTMVSAQPQPYFRDVLPDSDPGQSSAVAFSVDLSNCNIPNVVAGDKFFLDLNVGDPTFNHSVANFFVTIG